MAEGVSLAQALVSESLRIANLALKHRSEDNGGLNQRIKITLPTSPYLSLPLPTSPYLSLPPPTSPYPLPTSLPLPSSPYLSLLKRKSQVSRRGDICGLSGVTFVNGVG